MSSAWLTHTYKHLLTKKSHRCYLYCVQLCPTLVTLWTVPHHTPLSMAFSRQEYWSGSPFPSLRIKPTPLVSPALASELFSTAPPGKPKEFGPNVERQVNSQRQHNIVVRAGQPAWLHTLALPLVGTRLEQII